MKRSLVTVLVCGFGAAVVALGLHATGLLRPIERGVNAMVQNRGGTTSLAGEFWLYFLTCVLSVVVAWLTVSSLQRMKIGLLVAGLAVELLTASWIFALYGRTFQPLAPILATALAFVGAGRWIAFARRSRSQLASTFFADRLSNRQIRRLG